MDSPRPVCQTSPNHREAWAGSTRPRHPLSSLAQSHLRARQPGLGSAECMWRRLEPLARSRRRRLRARWRDVHFRSPDRSGVLLAVRGAPCVAASPFYSAESSASRRTGRPQNTPQYPYTHAILIDNRLGWPEPKPGVQPSCWGQWFPSSGRSTIGVSGARSRLIPSFSSASMGRGSDAASGTRGADEGRGTRALNEPHRIVGEDARALQTARP